jgi:hypothetical protein
MLKFVEIFNGNEYDYYAFDVDRGECFSVTLGNKIMIAPPDLLLQIYKLGKKE